MRLVSYPNMFSKDEPHKKIRSHGHQLNPFAPKVCRLTSTEHVTAGLDLKQLAEGLKRLRKYLSRPPDGAQGLPRPGGRD